MTSPHQPERSTVNPALTPEPRPPTTEADEFGAFTRRVLAAYSRRVADRDIEGLAGLAELRDDVDRAIAAAVDRLHAEFSWADIGRALGCTRQAAQQRYGR